jgi:hypothetical protein
MNHVVFPQHFLNKLNWQMQRKDNFIPTISHYASESNPVSRALLRPKPGPQKITKHRFVRAQFSLIYYMGIQREGMHNKSRPASIIRHLITLFHIASTRAPQEGGGGQLLYYPADKGPDRTGPTWSLHTGPSLSIERHLSFTPIFSPPSFFTFLLILEPRPTDSSGPRSSLPPPTSHLNQTAWAAVWNCKAWWLMSFCLGRCRR